MYPWRRAYNRYYSKLEKKTTRKYVRPMLEQAIYLRNMYLIKTS